jgi:hypothetical protein
MGRIQTAISHRNVSKIFQYVGKNEGVHCQIEVVIIFKGLTFHGGPPVLGALIFFVCYTLFVQFAVERVFGRQFGAIKFLKRIEEFVRENSFRKQ